MGPAYVAWGPPHLSIPVIQSSLVHGELSPSLWGRVDLEQFHAGASTLRNMFVNYKGGASSRAGTALVGISPTAGNGLPPRLIDFQFSIDQGHILEFGDQYMRVITDGAYVLEAADTITGITQANPAVVTTSGAHGFATGDDVYIDGAGGMTQINGKTYRVTVINATSFSLQDLFGTNINSTAFTAYTSGGTASRIYELATPWQIEDLPELKFTQSADVMSIVHPDYAPYDLTRLAANNWTVAATDFTANISPPSVVTVTPTVTTSSNPTAYSYVVTAVDFDTGEESIASDVTSTTESVDISRLAGSLEISWNEVSGAGSYNIYRGPVGYGRTIPLVGSLYGYVGSAFGLDFYDNNIVPDMSKVPPLALNPFAPGQIIGVTITNPGSGYTSPPTASISSATGSGAVLRVVGTTSVRAVIVENGGEGYTGADTITFSSSPGVTATGTLNLGPSTGTYPTTVAYFQQRRVYASTTNNPDTYFMSRIGVYNNMDRGLIPAGDDALIGTPWGQQVNGIQALVPMPGGLVVLTGSSAWQVNGGGPAVPITPTSQVAQPQAFNGCHDKIPPIVINYDILYVQAKGTIVRDLEYDFYTNIYTGTDLSALSSHLFENHTLVEWAWSEEPFKLLWAVRDDGVLLSMTFLKEQKVIGWSRHDTNGLFVSVASITEPPVDAVYVVVKRWLRGGWYYTVERFDNREWSNVEEVWALDAALAYVGETRAAELTADSAEGSAGILSIEMTNYGSGYTSTPTVTITDETGTGATATATVSGGKVTGITVTARGSGYSSSPIITFTGGGGSGAEATAIVRNFATITASAGVFTAADENSVLRMGGGIGTVHQYVSATSLVVYWTQAIAAVLQNDEEERPLPAAEGEWTISVPVSSVSGLDHLIGKTVNVLADGSVYTDLEVAADGSIELEAPASFIVAGLPFTAQVQTLYLDPAMNVTTQGRRKNITSVTLRMADSRGVAVGSNQPDASTQQPLRQNVPWTDMMQIKERNNSVAMGQAIPLFTGDARINVPGIWAKQGQVAAQQIYPLPFNLLAVIPEFSQGDSV